MARKQNKCVAKDILSDEQEPWAKKEVRFRLADKVIGFFQNDSLVISIRLNRYEMRRVLVNTGSSISLLTLNVFNKLGLDKNNLIKISYPLVRLEDKTVAVLGTINLPIILGNEKHKRELYAEFAVIDILLAYNVILDHPVLNSYSIVINMNAMCLNLPALGGLTVVRGNQKSAQECYKHFTRSLRKATMPIDLLEKLDSHIKPKLADPMEEVQLGKDKKKI